MLTPRILLGSASLLTIVLGTSALAQSVDLPEIHVSTPSPIASRGSSDTGFASLTLVTAQQTLAQGAVSFGDMLATTPGVSSTSFSPVATRPVIRGLGGFRVRTQENGVGTHDMANLGEDHAVTIDPLLAGNVEVVRGPGTLRYGSQAIGGVVSSSNNRIPTRVPENGLSVMTRGGYSSVNNGKDGAVSLDAGGGNFAIHLDAFKRTGGDYSTPDGKQLNSGYDGEGQAIGGSYIFDSGFMGLSYQNTAMTYFIPGLQSAPVQNNIKLRQQKWAGRGEFRIGESGIDTVRYWLGYTTYKHEEANGVGALREVGSTFANREFESRVEISHLPVMTAWGELRGAVGLQYGSRHLSVLGADEPLLAPAKAENIAAFVFEELQITQALRAQAAIRVEKANVSGIGATFPANFLPPPNEPNTFAVNRSFVPVSGSFGFLYELPHDVIARVTVQHVERSPDTIELFYKGPHDAPRTFEIGDPNMQLEKADSVEVGFKRAVGDTRFDVSAYYTKFQNYIYKNFTGNRCDVAFASCGGAVTSYDQITYSQRDATFIGAELQVEHDVGKIWSGVWGVEAQYDIVHASFKDGSAVPKLPPQRLGSGFYFRNDAWNARVNLLHAFAQNRLGAFETATPGYNLLNAELSHTAKIPFGNGQFMEATLGIRGENLLNDRIRFHQSYKKDEVLQPGRNIRVFASTKF